MSRTTVRVPTPSGDELEAWVYQPEGTGPHLEPRGETDCAQRCVALRADQTDVKPNAGANHVLNVISVLGTAPA